MMTANRWIGRAVTTACAALLLCAVPFSVHAAQSHSGKKACHTARRAKVHALAASAGGPIIRFGQYGGNMRPWDAALNADGTITAKEITGAPRLTGASKDTLNGLLALAQAEGFWSMPAKTACPGTLPDVASRYIEITSSTGTRRVDVHGGCVDAFNQLFAVVMSTGNLHF